MRNNLLKEILKFKFNRVLDKLSTEFSHKTTEIETIIQDYESFGIAGEPFLFNYNKDDDFCKCVKNYFQEEFNETDIKKISQDLNTRFKTKYGNLTIKEAFILDYYKKEQPRCPFCGSSLSVSIKRNKIANEKDYKYTGVEFVKAQIEHLFPQSKFPQLVLHPYNWVPICEMCNVSKNNNFFDDKAEFETALENLQLSFDKLHPLKLYECFKMDINFNISTELNKESDEYKLFEFYNLHKRWQLVLDGCYNSLFNIIRNADIRSGEALEKFLENLLENLSTSDWRKVNDGYSLYNNPHIMREFVENILYDECKLMALWDELKATNLIKLKH